MDTVNNTMGVGYEPNQMSTQAGFAAQQPASGFGQNAFNQGIGSLPPAGGAISPTMNTQAVGALGTMLGGMVQPSVGGQVQGPYGSGMQFPINSTNSTTTADMMRGGTGAPFGQVVGQLGMNQPGMGQMEKLMPFLPAQQPGGALRNIDTLPADFSPNPAFQQMVEQAYQNPRLVGGGPAPNYGATIQKQSGPMMTPEQVANMPGPSLAQLAYADLQFQRNIMQGMPGQPPLQYEQYVQQYGSPPPMPNAPPQDIVPPPIQTQAVLGQPGMGGTMLGQQQEQLVKGLPSQEQMAAMQQVKQLGQPGMGDALISKAMAYPGSTMRPAVQPPVIDRGGRARTPSYAPRAVPANVPERGYFGDDRFDGRGVGGSSGSNIRPTSSMRDMRERGEERAREMRSDMTDRRYGGGQQSRMDYFQNRLNELGGGNLKNLFGPASGGLASLFNRRRG